MKKPKRFEFDFVPIVGIGLGYSEEDNQLVLFIPFIVIEITLGKVR